MYEYIILIIGGVFSGLLTSLFGLGGSLTTVPTLLIALPLLSIEKNEITHVAIATSLAIMFVNSILSMKSHHSSGNIRWDIFKSSILFIILGTFAGTYIAMKLDSKKLLLFYLFFVFFIIIRFLRSEFIQKKETKNSEHLKVSWRKKTFYEIITGIISACVGGGSSLVMVPFYKHQGFKMKEASALAVSFNVIIAFFATINYMFINQLSEPIAKFSTGYIYWPAFLFLLLGSFVGVPIGVKLANKLSEKFQTVFYFLFIVVVFILMTLKYLKA
ncbi:sulfite exporter TauE/SafE family protein [Aureivirga sp. CE67]|uniref:sulfite exporter TauE/SafE family protein n=1 Tax=Aureivirga sp. CE67 TaxID=1788983 RepID=UPI0018C993C8|nr:sulfite exporter TauE/SafE family protein [Aureivirga sp. CE67]